MGMGTSAYGQRGVAGIEEAHALEDLELEVAQVLVPVSGHLGRFDLVIEGFDCG